jgi:RimJ/RimL family protein N-acetyltransferase
MMVVSNVSTERLILIPMNYSLLCSVLENRDEELDALGIKRDMAWPGQDTMDILSFLKENLKNTDEVSGFDVWMIVKKEDQTIIGDAGFKGLPDEQGNIEIGFGLVEKEQRKGYGYETANALIDWAFTQKGVKKIKADCLIDNYGSIRVLQKCKMHEIGRDNELIYWELASR